MEIKLRDYRHHDLKKMLELWNEVIFEGANIPFEYPMNIDEFKKIIKSMRRVIVAIENKEVVGFYTLSPNIPGRGSTIANSTYIVAKEKRGNHIGEQLVKASLILARHEGFRIMQFNGVVDSNIAARRLYEKLGFKEAGIIPKGFRTSHGYEDMHIYYYDLGV